MGKKKIKRAATTESTLVQGLNRGANVRSAVKAMSKESSDVEKLSTEPFKRVKGSFRRKGANDRAFYTKYGDITPAANENRLMNPLFNTSVTINATMGVPSFVDVEVEWKGFADTYMMDQVTYTATQALRKSLKSNLPYGQDVVKRLLVNNVALTIMAKEFERDVHWNLYTGHNNVDWSVLYRKVVVNPKRYGIGDLKDKNYLDDLQWANTSAYYDKIARLFNSVVKLPTSLGAFISHYFGSLFTSQEDGHNDQYIRINMHEVDFYKGSVLDTIDVSEITIEEFLALLNQHAKDFAIVIADLDKALALSPSLITEYRFYQYYTVYDETLLQALINGYTSVPAESGITEPNFVRMDRMPGVTDDLTQYLFLGGIQTALSGPSNVHALTILSMAIKVNSDSSIFWPVTFSQEYINSGKTAIQIDHPFAIQLVSDMRSLTQVSAIVGNAGETDPIRVNIEPAFAPAAAAGMDEDLGIDIGTEATIIDPKTITFVNPNGLSNASSKVWSFIPAWFGKNKDANNDEYLVIGVMYACHDHANNLNYSNFRVYRTKLSSGASIEALRDVYLSKFENPSRVPFIISDSDSRVSSLPSLNPSTSSDVNTAFAEVMKLAIGESRTYSLVCVGQMTDQDNVSWVSSVKFTMPTFTCVCTAGMVELYGQGGSVTTRWAAFSDGGVPQWLGDIRNAYVNVANSGNATVDVSIVGGLEGLIEYVADIFDYHLPLFVRSETVVKFTLDGTASTYYGSTMATLVKENYIPYFYNTLDLVPVLYEMFTSLFAIDTRDIGPKKQGK